MDLLLLLCFVSFHLQIIDGASATVESDFSASATRSDDLQSARGRKPRRILRKIHNGVAFLAGVKVGTLLAHKGFDLGHGSLAASNTFQLFGKPVSSAISLSYGGVGQKLPLLDEIPSNETVTTRREKDKEDIVHVTVVRNPSPDTIEKLSRISNVSVADLNRADNDVIIVESDPETTASTQSPIAHDELKFIREHNKRVSEINREVQRRNSKF